MAEEIPVNDIILLLQKIATRDGTTDARLEQLESESAQISRVLFRGNGEDSLMTRLKLLERGRGADRKFVESKLQELQQDLTDLQQLLSRALENRETSTNPESRRSLKNLAGPAVGGGVVVGIVEVIREIVPLIKAYFGG